MIPQRGPEQTWKDSEWKHEVSSTEHSCAQVVLRALLQILQDDNS